MELLSHLATGFGVAATPANLGFALAGCFIGTLIGVLPGIGPIATIAMLLPLTFHLEPVSGLIMLAGIFYGAQYGGSTTAILVNLPGETAIRWRGRAVLARPWRWQRLARFSPVPSAPR
jgi:putative tricarboxylic transport membrane protein